MLHTTRGPIAVLVGVGAAVLLSAAACGGPPSPGTSPRPAATEVAPDTLTGTIRSVEPGRRTLEVIAGSGLVLKVIEFRVPGTVAIVWHGREVPLTAMVPGYVVRIQYRETESGMVAERIEETTGAPSGSGPDGSGPDGSGSAASGPGGRVR